MKAELTAATWTEVATTTVDTVFSSPNGVVLVSTEDPSATGFENAAAYRMQINGAIVIGAGKTVWAYPESILYGRELMIQYMAVGV